MEPLDFKKIIRRPAFAPLRVVISSGESYVIKHRDMVLISEECLEILSEVKDVENEVPRHIAWCDWINVSHVEPVRGNGRAPGKRVGKKAR